MDSNLISKSTILDYLWQYSRFYCIQLNECEELYIMKKGYAAISLLFYLLENISKSVVNDYDSSTFEVYKQLKNQKIITEKEHDFLNNGPYSIRKIRNMFAHANISAINLVTKENSRIILNSLTENDSCLILYDIISDIIFKILFKIVLFNLVEEVKMKFSFDLTQDIDNCSLEFKTLTSKEMLVMKGFPDDYIPDDLNIPEDAKIRIIENSPDVGPYMQIFKSIVDKEKNGDASI